MPQGRRILRKEDLMNKTAVGISKLLLAATPPINETTTWALSPQQPVTKNRHVEAPVVRPALWAMVNGGVSFLRRSFSLGARGADGHSCPSEGLLERRGAVHHLLLIAGGNAKVE